MKYVLSLALLCLFFTLSAQITFEEVTPPDDFSLTAIRKSPTGEYFTQAINNRSTIYSSLDGENWIEQPLPDTETIDDIQFYADGTPVLKFDSYDHFIRRDGSWHLLDFNSGSWGGVEASFIKEDTLFAFQDNLFAYSIDKGATFVSMFPFVEASGIHRSRLWVFEEHLVLYHTVGATYYVSIFNREGTRIHFETLNVSFVDFVYSSCGQILIYDYDNYYLISGATADVETGAIANITLEDSNDNTILSANGDWYLIQGSTLSKSSGCAFEWTQVLEDDLLLTHYKRWINDNGDVLLTNDQSDRFVELTAGTSELEEKIIAIDYANANTIDESYYGRQVSATPSHVFFKTLPDENWGELMATDNTWNGGHFSPNGDLYLNLSNTILYSQDDGQSFTTIEVPSDFGSNVGQLQVLDNGVLYVGDGFIGGHYTTNNGQDWHPVSLGFAIDGTAVGLAGNDLIVANLGSDHQISKINTITHETVTESLGNFYGLYVDHYTIREDGTIFFYYGDPFGQESGFYRFKFGEPLMYMGLFSELSASRLITTSGTELYSFYANEYALFDGTEFIEYSYTGLPSDGYARFHVANNQHLYAIIDDHRIFRSTEPLSSPQHIIGQFYYNEDEDCEPDASENTLAYWQVKVEGDSYLRIKNTDGEGRFDFSVPLGEYTLSAQPISAQWELCEPSFDLTVSEDDEVITQDLQAKALADCAMLDLDFSTPLLRRCFDNYYTVRVRNTGPLSSAGTTLTLELDPFFDFLSAGIPYMQLSDTEFEFDLGVLELNEEVVFNIYFNLSCEAELGQEHCLSGALTDANTCISSFSSYRECQENIGSFDPNDKRMFSQNGQETTTVDLDEYIYYHIRFQNTGTDTAFQVRVVDPLSAILDINTLEMLSASHSYEYTINDGPSLVVTFADVLLPDSTTNEVASHGYFRFKVKPLAEYDYGTVIPNQAGIYFDFNEPVITNEAVLTIQDPTRVREPLALIPFQVFPNPTAGLVSIFNIDSDTPVIEEVELVNAIGELVLTERWRNGQQLDITALPSGVYQLILKVKGQVIGVEKLVKM